MVINRVIRVNKKKKMFGSFSLFFCVRIAISTFHTLDNYCGVSSFIVVVVPICLVLIIRVISNYPLFFRTS